MYDLSKPVLLSLALTMLVVTLFACNVTIFPPQATPAIREVTKEVPVTKEVIVTKAVPTPPSEQLLSWQAIDGQWSLEQDVLVGTTPGTRGWTEGRYIASPGTFWQDYTFTGQLRFHQDQRHEVALLFRIQDIRPQSPREQDQGHYYQLSLYARDSNVTLFRIENVAVTLKTVPYTFVSNRWYRFSIETRSTNLKFFLDDVPVLEYGMLREYPSGGVGVKTFGPTIGYFKELRLRLQR